MIRKQDDRNSDQLLLLRLREGSSAAFDLLYETYWQNIYTAAFKRLQDPDQAKDITQEVFLQLWLKREENHIENLPAYLHTAVKNKVFNWMEKARKFTPITELLHHLETASGGTEADTEILSKEFMVAYEALVDTLTVSQQKIFRMRYQEDLSTIEIAEKLNISRKTVQNQLGKAVAQLRGSLTLITIMLLVHHK